MLVSMCAKDTKVSSSGVLLVRHRVCFLGKFVSSMCVPLKSYPHGEA
ncbi:hypothetical protein FUAX_56060 (plasmid) [Fulvitalea axinellae]|uniref:Uncharacterized protein n=1 Tax=Fulvitalea axinellae TaxID=1182444 RepID=A0AAU9DFF1_9BACT|nr:hypothetical protein FUAX_56060 [Fulvitalea axinellae]